MIVDEKADKNRAAYLIERLGIQMFSSVPKERHEELYLKLDQDGLMLCRGALQLKSSWEERIPRLKQQNLEHELILKAVRIKDNPALKILDATAGLGEDSLILASAGYSVSLYESDPVIGALLEEAMRKAAV